MPTALSTRDAARDTFVDTVLPAMRNGLHTARDKGGELLDSDAAHEARRRGRAMLLAARGEPVVALRPGRRRLRALGLISLGCAVGAGLVVAWQRLMPAVAYDTYERLDDTMTHTGTAATDERIDLRSGMPT